jgi:hypothetical protein
MRAMNQSAHHNPRGARSLLCCASISRDDSVFMVALIRALAVEHINQGKECHQMSISVEKPRRG